MFSFETTAGSSQSTAKNKLAGNQIHTVKYAGTEVKDIVGVKDPSMTYKTLILKWENEDGIFEHTIFEPKDADKVRGEREFTNKNGVIEKIPQPSNIESMMLLLKHAIDVVNPEVAKKIDNKEQKLGARTWDEFRKVVAAILDKGKGSETNIKLVVNKKGEGVFPGFFVGINREGVAYIKNNFIGNKVAFSSYETGKMKDAAQIPSKVDSFQNKGTEDLGSFDAPEQNLDLDFDVANL